MALRKKMVIATITAGAVVLGSAATAYGLVRASDTDDHFSVAAGTTVTGNLKSGTTMAFTGSINGIPITVNCTKFTAKGKTPKTGLTVTLSTPPTISGCTDSLRWQ